MGFLLVNIFTISLTLCVLVSKINTEHDMQTHGNTSNGNTSNGNTDSIVTTENTGDVTEENNTPSILKDSSAFDHTYTWTKTNSTEMPKEENNSFSSTVENNIVRSAEENNIDSSTKENNIVSSTEENSTVSSTEENKIMSSTKENNTVILTEENYNAFTTDINTNAILKEKHLNKTTFNLFWSTQSFKWYSSINAEDVESYILRNETKHFLSTFESGYQRDVLTTQLRYCPFTSLCEFSLGLWLPYYEIACCSDCSCDFPACLNNKTCCPDVLFRHINMFNSIDVSVKLPGYLAGQKVQKDCISLIMSKDVTSSDSVFGFSSCPLETEAGLVRNCTRQYDSNTITDLTDTIPVINKENFELFRNKYCALCNGMLENQTEKLQLRLKCTKDANISTEKTMLKAILDDGSCHVEFFSEHNLDECRSAISECRFPGGFEQNVCSMYKANINVNGVYFQNVFCSLCNDIIPENFMCSFSENHRDIDVFSFSGLLKLDQRQSFDFLDETADNCPENQLYDGILNGCRDIVCSGITVLENRECKDVFEKLEGTTYTSFLRLKPIGSLLIADAYTVADDVIDHMRNFLNGSYLCGMQMMYKSNMTFLENDQYAVQNSYLLYFEVRTQYHVPTLHDPYQVTEELLELHESEHTFQTKNSNKTITFRFEVRYTNPKIFDIISLMSKSDAINDGVNHYVEDVRKINLSYLVENYVTSGDDNLTIFPHLRINDDIGSCDVKKQQLDILSLTRCPKVNISMSDVPWVETADGVKFLRGDYGIARPDYFFHDVNHVMLCIDKYKEYMSHVLQRGSRLSGETIVSIVCSAISILSLCFTFIIFCFFSQLRQSIPGKNNMSLIFTLVCAQSFYLIGSFGGFEKTSPECAIVGLLVHFSWLVALFWMNICTYHMFRVLVRTKVISTTSGNQKIVFYHVYAVIMAAICVSVNIALSHNMYDNIGYGGTACYISSQHMIIFTFIIPTGMIVLSNIFMFIFVIFKIKRTAVVQKSVQNERNDIIIFAKLSTITGATWTFGFLYIWTDLTAMSYLFILMNASQGLFIMFAFVINRRVLDLFKGQVLGLTVTVSDNSQSTKISIRKTKL